MKIESVHIKNFRAIENALFRFDDYTCLVGANGAGKSTVLSALNIFFGHQAGASTNIKKLSDEDFFQRKVENPIDIKVTFSDLSSDAKLDLKHYVRNGKLIVTARAEFSGQDASIKQFASRLGMIEFAPFFEQKKAGDAKPIFDSLRQKYHLENGNSHSKRAEILNAYEALNPEACEEIESEAAFYGISNGVDRLERHIQWVYVPAVKDASDEEVEGGNTAFSQLLSRAVRSKVDFTEQLDNLRKTALEQYQGIIEGEKEALSKLSTSLEARLQSWGSPRARIELDWYQDPKRFRIDEPSAKLSTGELGFIGSPARSGHGLQRSYIISLLEELASFDEENNATLILGIEEPELYQHPPQAKHLAHVLQSLSAKNAQVISATHSPHFVNGKGFESVRLIRRNSSHAAYCSSIDFATLAEKESAITGKSPNKPSGVRAVLDPLLQPHISEMLFSEKIVLVEGLEDHAIFSAWIEICGLGYELRKRGVSIIPVNGKSNLLRPAIIATQLQIPTLMVFDCDNDCDEKYKTENQRDNARNVEWSKQTNINPNDKDSVLSENLIFWPDNIQKSIFEKVEATKLVKAKEKARALCGHTKNLTKNTVWLGELLIIASEEKWDMTLLNTACNHICSDNW